MSIAFGLLCSFSDPGVMPRNTFDLEVYYNVVFDANIDKFYFIKGRRFKIKYCSTCMIIRPIGTSHCRTCNCCVERYDHHCPWVGNCIGKNNYTYFYCFLLFLNLLIITTLSFAIYNLTIKSDTKSIVQIILASLVCIY
jgi:hypothetical protein